MNGHVLRILRAEALKQHRRMSGSKLVFFSMLLWPLLQLSTTYYTVLPVAFAGTGSGWRGVADPAELLAFLATGALAFSCFYALVQSAWHFSFERQTGTLELLFLTPANRLALVVANGIGALLQNAWLFVCFAVAMLGATDAVHLAHPAMLAVVFLALMLPAIAWGAFLNSLLIFSRDSAFLHTLFDEPMRFLSGAQVPTFALPVGAAAIGGLFPLTISLDLVRAALIEGAELTALLPRLGRLLAMTAALVALAAVLLKAGERRAMRTGQLRLF
ncbi:ABC transporter permease [Streptomyces sp. NPDC096339]|uniref:ABC transporter permease n=1 Tax=Streptomyces sp. NPDC096339 TaxID=3366086 RepID=UPI0037F29375